MEFKTVREAFDWLQKIKSGRDDRNCWRAFIEYEKKRFYSDVDDRPAKDAILEAEDFCSQWEASGNPPGDAERKAMKQFTDTGADALLAGLNGYCDWLGRHSEMVPDHFYVR